MSILQGKKILLAVTGSIAAYKTPHLVRLLVKQGAQVKVITTDAAATLVSPLALSTVSRNPVLNAISSEDQWNNHVALGYWADLMLIAPLSANTLAHLATGLCSNLLHAVYLSAKCPVVIAPAMDEDMWHHDAVRKNMQVFCARKNHYYIPVENGELASGLVGEGRMAEPEHMMNWLEHFFGSREGGASTHLNGLSAVVTAGPTYELLDPVRFIGNFSTGKMGKALAAALAKKGFEVDLICGPGVSQEEIKGVKRHDVVSALEMKEKVESLFPRSKITIMAAAVADYRPKEQAGEKIKKGDQEGIMLALTRNPDIIKGLGAMKKDDQILVGFALETTNELKYAREKLKSKNADYIALNSMRDEGAGFGKDTNKISLIHKDGTVTEMGLASKEEIAETMIQIILEKEMQNV